MKLITFALRQTAIGLFVTSIALAGATTASAGSYTINFDNPDYEDTEITKETPLSKWISEDGHQYIKRIAELSNLSFYNEMEDFVLFGSNNSEKYGVLNFELTEAGRVIPTKMVIKMRKQNTDPSIICDFNLKLYDSSADNGVTQQVYETTATEYVFEGSTMPNYGGEPIDNIILSTNFAVRLYSVTVYFDDVTPPADPEIGMDADPEVPVEAGTTITIGCPGAKSIAITDYTISGHALAPTVVEGESAQYTIDANHRRIDVVATMAEDKEVNQSAFFAVKDAEYIPTLTFGKTPESAAARFHATAAGKFERLDDEEDGTQVYKLESTGALEGSFTVHLAGQAHGGHIDEALTNDDFHAHQIDPDDPSNCTETDHKPYVLITEDGNPMTLVSMNHPAAVPFSTHPNEYHGVTKAFNDATVELRLKPFESAELTVVPHGVKTTIEKIDAAVPAQTFEAYSLDGIRLKAVSAKDLAPGLYIIRQGNKAAKVLVR
ncbi:MAG: hypothetical protein K2K84_08555 [Muribaculaceae bacterium]|nr:hypothetical protein [Muribaculaceae bacterium]